jgi:amidohydrolase
MVEAGAMHNVDYIFGAHIGAHLESGVVFVSPGAIMAGSDVFTAHIRGRSAHAARPNEGIDAIVLAAHTVLACQNAVARRLSPAQQGVLTIGMLHGGIAENIVAGDVTLRGTVRYFDEDVRDTLHAELRRALAVADALGGSCELDLRYGYPPVNNHEHATDIARRAIASALGTDAVAPFEPMMAAEDFAILSREAPGCFFWVGAGLQPPREHHHPHFDIDESALIRGATALASCAIAALDTGKQRK